MTTILQGLPSGASTFDRTSLGSSSYSDLANIDSSMLQKPGTEQQLSYLHTEYDGIYNASSPSSAPSSPSYTYPSQQHSYTSTPASSLSLDNGDDMDIDEELEQDIDRQPREQSAASTKTPTAPPYETAEDESHNDSIPESIPGEPANLKKKVNDDQAIEPEPTRHVDYLSHQWREEDIWSSWRYIVSRRRKISNCVRLENAAWRTWMKAKYDLNTVSPEKLNWLKDCDVTWLYGPLQVETRKSLTFCKSQPASQLSTSSSFLCKKPILKKKSASAVILERSRSQHSLLQRASDIIRQQQSSPAHGTSGLDRDEADFRLRSYTGSSVANTPVEQSSSSFSSQRQSFTYSEAQTPIDQKHVLFDEEVRQVQAIDSDGDDDKVFGSSATVYDSDEDDDGELLMAMSKTKGSNRSTPRNSFSSENKTIIPLPSTTLKYRSDTPDPPINQAKLNLPAWPSAGRKLSPSPSQETLRPSRPSHNFLIDDDPEISDEPWHTSNDTDYSPYEDENEPGPNMRRTPSGMFMPYDENYDEAGRNHTLLGQAAYAVNTFKDIAHVVWNVGWNRR